MRSIKNENSGYCYYYFYCYYFIYYLLEFGPQSDGKVGRGRDGVGWVVLDTGLVVCLLNIVVWTALVDIAVGFCVGFGEKTVQIRGR